MTSGSVSRSFVEMVKNSGISRFSRVVPQTYTKTANDSDCTFGMKRNFPTRYWGQPLEYVRVSELDSEFGFPEFKDAKDEHNRYLAWKELYWQFGTHPSHRKLYDSVYGMPANEANRTVYAGSYYPAVNSQVIGRILNRTKDGFAVGIAGLVGHLPFNEVPPGTNWNQVDFIQRKPMIFTVKYVSMIEAEEETNSSCEPRTLQEPKAKIVLSLKHNPSTAKH
jgi:hypothetical protein